MEFNQRLDHLKLPWSSIIWESNCTKKKSKDSLLLSGVSKVFYEWDESLMCFQMEALDESRSVYILFACVETKYLHEKKNNEAERERVRNIL